MSDTACCLALPGFVHAAVYVFSNAYSHARHPLLARPTSSSKSIVRTGPEGSRVDKADLNDRSEDEQSTQLTDFAVLH